MTQPAIQPDRHVLTDAGLAAVFTAIAGTGSTAHAVAVTITATFTALLEPSGQTLASYGPDRPLAPSRFAIPAAQWLAISQACLSRADAFGGRAHAALDLVNLMPASYDDPAVTVTAPPPPDQRPYEYVLTVTREATDVIAAASARCTALAGWYGPGSAEHLDAVTSWEQQASRLFDMSLGTAARVMRDGDLSLLVTTSTGFTCGIIFHPARRHCTAPGCTALIASDGTARAAGPACPDGQHQPSCPAAAPEPGTWSFHS
jgi:hypothetical protein